MTQSVRYVRIVFFPENKSFGAQPFALILCQYIADITVQTNFTPNVFSKEPSTRLEIGGTLGHVKNFSGL